MSKIVSDESLRKALAHLASAGKRCTEEERARREAQLAGERGMDGCRA